MRMGLVAAAGLIGLESAAAGLIGLESAAAGLPGRVLVGALAARRWGSAARLAGFAGPTARLGCPLVVAAGGPAARLGITFEFLDRRS
jgi:hypothetical protein